jgi:hypothetical protein
MADEVLLPSTGYVYTAPVDTAMPTLPINDPKAPGTPWTSIGNTSLENGISRETDGDDPETLGSWQNPSLKTTRPVRTKAVTLNLMDHTVETYMLYYGGGTVVGNDGTTPYQEGTHTVKALKVPVNQVAQERALLIIAVDGDKQVVEYYPSTSIIGSDAVETDPTQLEEVPVTATCLSNAAGDSTGTISELMTFPATP